MGEGIDRAEVAAGLGRALPLQARDAMAAALAAGTLPGVEGVTLQAPLRRMATHAVEDLERLAGRIATFGDHPSVAPPEVSLPKTVPAALRALRDMLQETLDALVDAIPADADDAEGEATEHLLEHVIARKRDDLELLERALR